MPKPLLINGSLKGKVALVAGATRGAGRGIARSLGAAGATVYCTGRSSRHGAINPNRPETIEETAEMVTAAGGIGVAKRVDHSDEEAVRELFSSLRSDTGRLDILINDIWGGDSLTEWGKPFWELDLAAGFKMMERAIHTHITTSRYGVPLMRELGEGLIVEVTDGNFHGYRGQLFYDLCKMSAIRLAYAMSVELTDTRITALAITPGFLRSEAVLDHFGVKPQNWRDAIQQDEHFAHSETPEFIGRVIAALAADENAQSWAGQALTSWDLARHYDVFDIEGRQPHWDEYLDQAIAKILELDSPQEEDLFLLRNRMSQLDFDYSRAQQRQQIESYLQRFPQAEE